MKSILCILILMSLGCSNQAKQVNDASATDSTNKVFSKNDNSKYYTTKDSIHISDQRETVTYNKEAFNQLVDEHPEFFKDFPEDPDLLYYSVGDGRQFGSELGQDEYYVLYAYFLKQKNNAEQYAECRNKITGIYNNINSLFQYFQHGGTYFTHQTARIAAYTEFTVYQYAERKDGFGKTYKISAQKDLYIRSLRQLIADESSIDFETTKEEKPARTKALNKIVDNIDKLITDNFYLQKAQAFHYDHYQYY